jgi:phosphotransferase system HPr-like phosphotransfer protein
LQFTSIRDYEEGFFRVFDKAIKFVNEEICLYLNFDDNFMVILFEYLAMNIKIVMHTNVNENQLITHLSFCSLLLVCKIVRQEDISKVVSLAITHSTSCEVLSNMELFILNSSNWRLPLTTPQSLALDLLNILFPKKPDIIESILSEFNNLFRVVMRAYKIYFMFSRYTWTLVIIQHLLLKDGFNQHSVMLSHYLSDLTYTNDESLELMNCFDLLTLEIENDFNIKVIKEYENEEILLDHLNINLIEYEYKTKSITEDENDYFLWQTFTEYDYNRYYHSKPLINPNESNQNFIEESKSFELGIKDSHNK